MEAFRLYSPFWLVLAPVAVAALWWRMRPPLRPAAIFSSVADLKDLPFTLAQRIRRTLPYLYGAGLCLVIAGLARPQSGRSESRITGEGIALEIVLDISGSMEALDFQLEGRDVSHAAKWRGIAALLMLPGCQRRFERIVAARPRDGTIAPVRSSACGRGKPTRRRFECSIVSRQRFLQLH
jgi:hypothetical protein